jgi:hypothetical protein
MEAAILLQARKLTPHARFHHPRQAASEQGLTVVLIGGSCKKSYTGIENRLDIC